VYDTKAAANVSAAQSSNENAGQFQLVIIPTPGHSLTDLEASADAILERFKTDGPTAEEVQRATAGIEANLLSGLQSNLNKAFTLADGLGYHGSPAYFETNYRKSTGVTPADVKRVANTYLTKGRVILSIVPLGKVDQASKPAESKKVDGGGTR